MASTINTLLHYHLPSSSLHSKRSRHNLRIPFVTSDSYRGKHIRCFINKREMTIKPVVRIADRRLMVKDRTVIITDVPDNVITSSASVSGSLEGMFIGAELERINSRHVVRLGKLQNVRFMACFRFKLWWMAQKMGDKGSEIPLETQFVVLETNGGDDEIVYTVFLPLIEGPFRACLQGNVNDDIELCIESGDVDTKASSFHHSMFVHAGTDPFLTISEAVKGVKHHLNTFRPRNEKQLPGIVDFFGWCTWDAFYQDVTQEGVESGLQSLIAGGTPPKFVIIDDGWQSVGSDSQEDNSKHPPLYRLTGIRENSKFQNKNDPSEGIKKIVSIAKEKHKLKYVYVWHAITGYWGGVRSGVKEMEEYDSSLKYPTLTKGVTENEPGWKTDPIAVQGMGLVNPRSVYKFYDELHSYLASAGVDGVKVDVQSVLETLGSGIGGRVELTRKYHQALDASVAKNFRDNGCIACMSHNTDSLYCSKQTAVVRASDDFYPRDAVSHTIHVASVAYNSVFLGEFMQPDWDMFHSLHEAAEYHASARAISGGPLYVSDAPGKHNFELLKKLVLPDGSILRARLPARPTKDCLFNDPTRDGVSLLKIWNMNKYSGILGVYNCQGAAWNNVEKKNTFHTTSNTALTATITGRDVHQITEAAIDPYWNGDCALYSNRTSKLVMLPYKSSMAVSLKVLEHEIFTVTPIKVLGPGLSFAPIGLINMYNGGGAIEALEYEGKEDGGRASIEVKGCGIFGAYSLTRPEQCMVDSGKVDFEYDSLSGLMKFSLDCLPKDGTTHTIVVELL